MILTQALLNSEVSPLSLRHQVSLGDQLGQVLGQHDVAVLVLVVCVLVAVVDLLLRHDDSLSENIRCFHSSSLTVVLAFL